MDIDSFSSPTLTRALSDTGIGNKFLVYPEETLNNIGLLPDIGYVLFFVYDREGATRLGNDSPSGTSIGGDGVINNDISRNSGIPSIVSPKLERLDKVIVLPMPSQLQHPLGVNIQESDLKTINAIYAGVTGGTSDSDSLVKGALGGTSSALASIVTGSSVGQAIADRTGRAVNDRKENFFRGVNFREFTFQYTLMPESLSESKRIQEIIKFFRFYMLPSQSRTNPAFFLQPSEFLIKFFTGTEENKSIPKISRCLLRNVNVDYAPRSKWISLRGGEGFPNEVIITLNFIEKASLYREAVDGTNGRGDATEDGF